MSSRSMVTMILPLARTVRIGQMLDGSGTISDDTSEDDTEAKKADLLYIKTIVIDYLTEDI